MRRVLAVCVLAGCTSAVQPEFPRSPLHVDAFGLGVVTSSPEGISCPPDCDAEFSTGSAVVLTATPASSGSIAGTWSAGCAERSPTCVVVAGQTTALVSAFHHEIRVSNGGAPVAR